MRWQVLGHGAVLSPGDRGFQYGDGLFETIAVRDGRLRFMDRHLERLRQGCRRLAIGADGIDVADQALRELMGKERAGTAKIIVTRGMGPRGYRAARDAPATVVVGFGPHEQDADLAHSPGIAMIDCRTRLGRNPALAGMKTLNRLEQVIARMEWNDPQIFEGLMQDEHGLIMCGTMTNLFVVIGGLLVTPALDRCGVRGIMRGIVMEQAQAAGIDVREIDCPPALLDEAGEIFVTNALIGMRPVVRIGERHYDVGPVTRKIAGLLVAGGVAEARL